MKIRNKYSKTHFLSNGLLFSSALLLASFTYAEINDSTKELKTVTSSIVTYEIKKTEKPKQTLKNRPQIEKKTPKVVKKTVNVKNKIAQEVKMTENQPESINAVTTQTLGITFDSIVQYKVTNITPDTIDFPNEPASFKGGYKAMNTFINQNLDLRGIELFPRDDFTVYIDFVIDEKGAVKAVKTDGKYPKYLLKEIQRMMHSMPKWNAGEHEGRKVNSRVNLPIRIDLQ